MLTIRRSSKEITRAVRRRNHPVGAQSAERILWRSLSSPTCSVVKSSSAVNEGARNESSPRTFINKSLCKPHVFRLRRDLKPFSVSSFEKYLPDGTSTNLDMSDRRLPFQLDQKRLSSRGNHLALDSRIGTLLCRGPGVASRSPSIPNCTGVFSDNFSIQRKDALLPKESAYYWYPYCQQIRLFSTETDRPMPSRTLGRSKVPTPPSAPPDESTLESLRKTTPKSIVRKGMDMTINVFKAGIGFLIKLPGNTLFYMTHPDELRQKWADIKQVAQDEINHYWVGFKLFWADIQTAQTLVGRTLRGSTLTRRERKQLLRTVTDLFRLIPFSMFLIIPFMEFALPFALRIFPNMLPSTFQDSLKAEENMKRELRSRIAMAQFFQETMEELAKEQKRKASKRKKELQEAGVDLEEDACDTIDKQADSAAVMLEFLEKARNGQIMEADVIIRYANYFQDDLTLDNMPRMQLINMCKYMNIPPYGSDAFLRFQLRHRIRVLKQDDQKILWEGIDSLTKNELREACRERGMRSTGLSKDAYKRSLQQWLDLSVNKNVPTSLLIMSRTFFLRDEIFERKADDDGTKSLAGLADAISGLDKEVLNEVILEVASEEEKRSDPDIRKIKLEVVSKQNELIKEEQAAREAAKKKTEALHKTEAQAADSLTAETTVATDETMETSPDSVAAGVQGQVAAESSGAKQEAEGEEERDLSTEEMDAISQLVSDDPVSKERAELERIKAAMREEDKTVEAKEVIDVKGPEIVEEEEELSTVAEVEPIQPMTSEEADRLVASTMESLDKQLTSEADAATKVVSELEEDLSRAKEAADTVVEHEEDPVVARLKKRIESMVDKIEVQLSHAHVKIGDKLHFLDKDRDGVLSREEVADVLQQVLKRKITFDEAMEIASEMDENHDGFFTVDQLIKWIDKHKLVKFVEEGRDADMDRIMESHTTDQQKDEEATSAKKTESS